MPSIFGQSRKRSSNLRVRVEKRSLALSAENDDDEELETESLLRRKYSFCKLPQQKFLKLSVLKLDGSLFDVRVGRNATVAEVKQAVEEVFSSSPKEGQEKISWSHVWSHFCLCYEGQKLINDKACIRSFGVKDGDQLQFTRHMSINCSYSKGRSRKQIVVYKPCSITRLSSESNVQADKESQQTTADHNDRKENLDHGRYEDLQEETGVPEFKLAHFLKGWLSYTRLWGGAARKGSEGKSRPSRFAMQSLQCLGGGQRMIPLQGQ